MATPGGVVWMSCSGRHTGTFSIRPPGKGSEGRNRREMLRYNIHLKSYNHLKIIQIKDALQLIMHVACIYTIICLQSVVVRKLQVTILARSPREMSQTDRIV